MTKNTSVPGAFRLEFKVGSGRHGLPCWLAIPTELDTDRPPLVAVHGIRRGAKVQAQQFGASAAKVGQVVIAPLFAEEQWPLYQQVVRKGRADIALLELMNDLRLTGIWQSKRFDLSGFSGGAQFAHRFAMLYPNLVKSLSVTSAGWYTFPDASPFPYGLGKRDGRKDDWGPQMESRLHEFLQIPLNIAVGSLDGERDSNTRSGTEIDHQQGANRIDRAHQWEKALLKAARERRLPVPDVRIMELPESGHDFIECVKKGGLVDFLMSDRSIERSEGLTNRRANRLSSKAARASECQSLNT